MNDRGHGDQEDVPSVHCTVGPDGVAWIVLDNPAKLNALTTQMLDHDLPEACRRVASDPEILGAVLIGVGRGFCSGADVGERLGMLASAGDADLDRPLGGFVLDVARLSKPVVAAINGTTAGGGLSLAAVADRRIALAGARITTGFRDRGLVPDGGLTLSLPALVGRQIAQRMLFEGATLDSSEALDAGLVDEVVPTLEELRSRASASVLALAGEADQAALATKRIMNHRFLGDLERHIELESDAQWRCIRDPGFRTRLEEFTRRRSASLPASEGDD